MDITLHGKNLKITADLRGETYLLLSGLPGRKKWEGRSLFASPCAANIDYLRTQFPGANWSKETLPITQEHDQKRSQADEVSKAKAEGLNKLSGDDGFVYKTKPYSHQREAFLLSRDMSEFGLLHEQGCGKTKVILDTTAYLYRRAEINALIIVAPNGVHRNWIENEVATHLPLGEKEFISHFYSAGLSPKKLEEVKVEFSKTPKEKLIICSFNVEGFVSEKAQVLLEDLLKKRNCLLVIDESTRIKNPGAKRTRFLWKAGKLAKFRRIMTGTPVTKGSEDLYAQFRFLNPNIIGHDTFTGFRNEFCIMGGFERKQIVGYQNIDKLTKMIDGYSHRVLKKDCLDLPEKIYKRFPFEMTPLQKKLYNELRTEFATELDGQELTAELAVTRLLRLQQITCNWFPGENFRPIGNQNPRLEAMKEYLEDLPGKVIVWARFRADLELIRQTLGRKAVSYYGAINQQDRAVAVKRFQEDDSILYFIGQPQSAGIGLTLTAAQDEIFYNNDFDLEKRLQAEDRAHRIGTKTNITITDLEAIGTVDRKIIESLRKKKNIANLITKDPYSFFMEEA